MRFESGHPIQWRILTKLEKFTCERTKLITCIKHLTHAERLSYLNLPTLYRRLRGDMIVVFKIVTGVMDSIMSCNFTVSHSVTRRKRYKLTQKHAHNNLAKFYFVIRVVTIWNSLPDYEAYLHAQLTILKIVWIIFGENKSACVSRNRKQKFCLMLFEF